MSDDGRYSDAEEAYITAIAAQLEATDVFQVNGQWRSLGSNSAYRLRSAAIRPICSAGLPPAGQWTISIASSWTDFFVQQTDSVFCSNYQSAAMDALVLAAREELDPAARADDLRRDAAPVGRGTADAGHHPGAALRPIAAPKWMGCRSMRLGLMHYETLSKQE